MNTVICLCDDIDNARQSVQKLVDSGIQRKDINFVVINTSEDLRVSKSNKSEAKVSDAFLSALKSMGVPDRMARHQAESVWRGEVMIAVDVPDGMVERAEKILCSLGGKDVYKQSTTQIGGTIF